MSEYRSLLGQSGVTKIKLIPSDRTQHNSQGRSWSSGKTSIKENQSHKVTKASVAKCEMCPRSWTQPIHIQHPPSAVQCLKHLWPKPVLALSSQLLNPPRWLMYATAVVLSNWMLTARSLRRSYQCRRAKWCWWATLWDDQVPWIKKLQLVRLTFDLPEHH